MKELCRDDEKRINIDVSVRNQTSLIKFKIIIPFNYLIPDLL